MMVSRNSQWIFHLSIKNQLALFENRYENFVLVYNIGNEDRERGYYENRN